MTTLTKPEKGVATRPAEKITYTVPPASVRDTAEGYVVTIEMPGVNKDGLEVTFVSPTLTVTGRRAPVEMKGDLLYRETTGGDFRRQFEIDPSIDATRISAKIEQGVLTLTLPKAEEVKPRRIEVTD
jgi:HSP20 family protein